jgi:hypothetical protein
MIPEIKRICMVMMISRKEKKRKEKKRKEKKRKGFQCHWYQRKTTPRIKPEA